jgi:hypothetical protein
MGSVVGPTALPDGSTPHHTATVDIASAAVNAVDATVTVSDSLGGSLGMVSAALPPTTFRRAYDVPHSAVATTGSGAKVSDRWDVSVSIPYGSGCTLTQGYGKTHSDRGPAPSGDAWQLVGAALEDTTFCLSGRSWYDVFRTPPAGNPYPSWPTSTRLPSSTW